MAVKKQPLTEEEIDKLKKDLDGFVFPDDLDKINPTMNNEKLKEEAINDSNVNQSEIDQTEETQEKLLSEVIKMIMDSAAEGEYPTEFYSKFYLSRKSISVNTDKLTEEALRIAKHAIKWAIKNINLKQTSKGLMVVEVDFSKYKLPSIPKETDAVKLDVSKKDWTRDFVDGLDQFIGEDTMISYKERAAVIEYVEKYFKKKEFKVVGN